MSYPRKVAEKIVKDKIINATYTKKYEAESNNNNNRGEIEEVVWTRKLNK